MIAVNAKIINAIEMRVSTLLNVSNRSKAGSGLVRVSTVSFDDFVCLPLRILDILG